ncbi:nicotinate phosphoribosyltransferase [Clydaea vesicula]|uniref:Nicotinate phosphoribosyltransferase n=1 Tax=Clydaea vesicula TaxID=447962 RepID=A0AAD5U308_9FUNG|nr:nicotinate phosphoribosyltransferase [Clydaea vesicula]KAJ3386693.1 nicotinate phosphoribosyltransferase [Lobulomyces angularis]
MEKFSILDNDLYKFSMQQAVLELYPSCYVEYEFTNRKAKLFKFNEESIAHLKQKVNDLHRIRINEEEFVWLKQNFPCFSEKYLSYLKTFRFLPSKQVFIDISCDFELILRIKGLWVETILYEVVILSLISETYFKFIDTDWNLEGQFENSVKKGTALLEGRCIFSEFGTRRRRSFEAQDIVVKGLIESSKLYEVEKKALSIDEKGCFSGTSNVFLAKKYGLKAIGTIAHEFIMAVSGTYILLLQTSSNLLALEKNLLHANKRAMEKWLEVYPSPNPGYFNTALCDTFGTDAFLKDFSYDLSKKIPNLRQDSGDPETFVLKVLQHYKKLNLEKELVNKSIIFSDGLNVEKCLTLKNFCKIKGEGITAKFGVGTFFTNDFKKTSDGEKSQPMDIVIKLSKVENTFVCKLSDTKGKVHGEENALKIALETFNL